MALISLAIFLDLSQHIVHIMQTSVLHTRNDLQLHDYVQNLTTSCRLQVYNFPLILYWKEILFILQALSL